jgi:Mn2+/Fe2+ NRAMP family transporter
MNMSAKFLIKIKKAFKILGPGLVTGASDDDPSGIATYSQAGAQFIVYLYGQSF